MTWSECDRKTVRAWIEEATGLPCSVDNPTPDSLTATAQAAGWTPDELREWLRALNQPGRPCAGCGCTPAFPCVEEETSEQCHRVQPHICSFCAYVAAAVAGVPN
jgi:hypothetical protein